MIYGRLDFFDKPSCRTAGRVGEGHLQWAVKLVVLCPCRGNIVVDCHAEAVYTLAVNSRMINPDHATERVIDHPAAHHHNLVSLSQRCEQQLKQQQQDDDIFVINFHIMFFNDYHTTFLVNYLNFLILNSHYESSSPWI